MLSRRLTTIVVGGCRCGHAVSTASTRHNSSRPTGTSTALQQRQIDPVSETGHTRSPYPYLDGVLSENISRQGDAKSARLRSSNTSSMSLDYLLVPIHYYAGRVHSEKRTVCGVCSSVCPVGILTETDQVAAYDAASVHFGATVRKIDISARIARIVVML